jgi:hypothetical protein
MAKDDIARLLKMQNLRKFYRKNGMRMVLTWANNKARTLLINIIDEI